MNANHQLAARKLCPRRVSGHSLRFAGAFFNAGASAKDPAGDEMMNRRVALSPAITGNVCRNMVILRNCRSLL